jgi:NADH-quinone oxidoreductase subunit J
MSATPLQIALSFTLVSGLVLFVGALILVSLARFSHARRGLGIAAFVGLVMFSYALLALSPPPFRLYIAYFWLFTMAVVGGAAGCITMRNVFHQALLLILSLFGVAGYFVLVGAEFLALVQVIIYIGGIMVLFLFGIMVSQNIIGSELRQNSPQAPWAAVCAGILFLFMGGSGLAMTFPQQPTAGLDVMGNNTQSLGWSLMATYTLPFICASIMLLMAMMGAIILVRKE